MRFIIRLSRSFIKLYAFLFAECMKKTYYNIKISIKLSYINVYNKNNKFKKRRLYKRKKGLYIGRRITLDPMGYSRCYDIKEKLALIKM